MDYEKLTAAIKLCGSEPSVRRCEKECFYYKGGDTKKCIPRMTADAATAITDLLARAEAAEEDRDRMREAMKPNCLLCDSMHENGNCTEVGGFCTAVPAAHCPLIPKLRNKLAAVEARAEKAEAELQVAVGALVGQCKYCRKTQECTSRKGPHIYCWEWRGQKEE